MDAPRPLAPRRGWVAPRLLDPILALAELIDRRVRRITPIQPGSILSIERGRYRGDPVLLRDGTRVRRGDRVDILHFVNDRLSGLGSPGWQAAALAQGGADLRVLAQRLAGVAAGGRPVAYRGATILAAPARRMGFEERPRSAGVWHRVEDWYLRSLLVRWAPTGRGRLSSGHSRLAVGEVWISTAELLRRYGPPAEAPEDQ